MFFLSGTIIFFSRFSFSQLPARIVQGGQRKLKFNDCAETVTKNNANERIKK